MGNAIKEFTYEAKTSGNKLEKYEWDNTWIEHTNDSNSKRVLYIGDSISCQIRQIATKLTEEQVLFDGYGSSKGVDNPYFMDSVRLFARQEGKRDIVLFNNGLHGWHLEDFGAYRIAYENMVCSLLEEFVDVPILLVLTTHVRNTEREQRVIARNTVVLDIAEKYKLNIIDLYTTSVKYHDDLDQWGVHFGNTGNIGLAKTLVKEVSVFL